jgi:hypothetical protein
MFHALVVVPEVVGQSGRTGHATFYDRVNEGPFNGNVGGYLLDDLAPYRLPVSVGISYPFEQGAQVVMLALENIHRGFPRTQGVPRSALVSGG